VVVDAAKGLYREVHPLIRNMKDGSVLALVPGGVFEMGDGQGTDCAKHRVHMDGYYIGVYCVTNGQYAAFVKATGHRAPDKADYGSAVWTGGRCPEEKLHHPVVCVSWDDAMAYAKWSGCELATEAQWEKAARGQNNFIYPWGEAWDARKCRNDKNKGSGQTCAVWEYPVGASGYGTYNQSGNVWEWCRDWYGEKYYSEQGAGRNPAGPASGLRRFSRSARRVGRGGSWLCVGASRCRGTDRRRCDPAYRCGDRGFRLVRTA
jgi:formylglycine-generating enzyme required for sulfatase activity